MKQIKISAIFSSYHQLIRFCDHFFHQVQVEYSSEIKCSPGCYTCCQLQTVCALEAVYLYTGLIVLGRKELNSSGVNKITEPIEPADRIDLIETGGGEGEDRYCPFLAQNICTVYEYRPIICRTHGLALLYNSINEDRQVDDDINNDDINKGERFISHCHLNFKENKADLMPLQHILDMETINLNLMRLNLAMAMVIGHKELADQRFNLSDLAAGKIDSLLQGIVT